MALGGLWNTKHKRRGSKKVSDATVENTDIPGQGSGKLILRVRKLPRRLCPDSGRTTAVPECLCPYTGTRDFGRTEGLTSPVSTCPVLTPYIRRLGVTRPYERPVHEGVTHA